MAKSDQSWGRLDPLAAEVVKGTLDGFFVSGEVAESAPKLWPDGQPVIRYALADGMLLFRPDAYSNYNFSSEEAFADALKKGGVPAKTVNGILSLGPARKVRSVGGYVLVRFPDAFGTLHFICEGPQEIQAVRSFLLAHLGDCEVIVAKTALGLAMSSLPRVNLAEVRRRWHELRAGQRTALRKGFLAAGALIALAVLSLIVHVPLLVIGLGGLGFAWFARYLMPNLAKIEDGSPPVPKK